ncbi:hypothetical protein ElyMa_004836100 [Elysia marginata]|uniref:Uncharacterized protein n=1 Tax=Elysia marginata TaxID=1093978 RepID=A0AAV4IP57_9GAST|nr:hypothetical protein ElyMa_004836100 [Elysia marginata]
MNGTSPCVVVADRVASRGLIGRGKKLARLRGGTEYCHIGIAAAKIRQVSAHLITLKSRREEKFPDPRHNNLEKLCLEGAVEGRRGRGRPRRRWTQDISDWLGFSVREASILAQDRDGFRSAVWEATSYKDPP